MVRAKDGSREVGAHYGLVFLAAFGCYMNSLRGDFVHDDYPAILRNQDVLGATGLLELASNDFWGTPLRDLNSHKSYRPLTTLTFRATHSFVGLQPFWYHVSNVFLHGVASLLFTRLCFVVARLQPGFAAFAGLLFATHPVHTEAVSGIVGRADVLACALFFLSLLVYHDRVFSGKGDTKRVLWSSLLACLAMLAKETGLTVLVVNLLLDVYRSWHPLRRVIIERKWNEEALYFSQRAAKVLMALSVLLVFRLALLQGSLPKFVNQDNPAAFHPHRHVRFLTFSYLAVFNGLLLLCPTTLSHDWQMGSIPLVASFSDTRNIATCLLITFSLLLAYKCFTDLEQQKHVPLILSCLLLVLPFLPAANILVTVGFVIAERVLYIPSSGLVLMVAYGMQLMYNKATYRQRALICSIIILILCCFTAKTVTRNKDWATRETLSRSGIKAVPQNAKMHYNWANCLRDKNETNLAVKHYREALVLWPQYASAHNNLGTLMTDPSAAEYHFLAAIRISPGHVNAHYNLGQVYRRVNRTLEAIKVLERCVSLNAEYSPAYLLLAKLHSGTIAGRLLHHVTLLNPNNPHYMAYYASWLFKHNRILEAQYYYKEALSISFSHLESLLGLARTLRSKGQKARLQQILFRWQKQLGNGGPRLQPKVMPVLYAGSLYLGSWELYKQGQVTSVLETRRDAFVYCINEGLPHLCQPETTPQRSESSQSDKKTKPNLKSSSNSKSYQ